MRPPRFWTHDGGRMLPWLLAPLSAVAAAATARRVARPGWLAPVPVLCCGNVTSGGAGKTTLALDIGTRLLRRGVAVHFLTRGYRGRAHGVVRVTPAHDAGQVGDETLLLAALAPTWVSADRAAGGRAAVEAGAAAIVMDDGLQNPGLAKTLSLLVIDGRTGFGNGRVLPAGPLREPVASGAARCLAAVLIGADRTGATQRLPAALPVLRAHPVPDAAMRALAGRKVFAVAGIAHPARFRASLAEAGAQVVGHADFPDHHRYTERELGTVLDRAARLDAVPVTTAKDAVRLPAVTRAQVQVGGISLAWDDEAAIEALLDGFVTPTEAA